MSVTLMIHVPNPNPPRYLLYRVLEPPGPYIVGTWEVRVNSTYLGMRTALPCPGQTMSSRSAGRASRHSSRRHSALHPRESSLRFRRYGMQDNGHPAYIYDCIEGYLFLVFSSRLVHYAAFSALIRHERIRFRSCFCKSTRNLKLSHHSRSGDPYK